MLKMAQHSLSKNKRFSYLLIFLLTHLLTGRVSKFVLPIHPDAFVVRNRYIYSSGDWSRCLGI